MSDERAASRELWEHALPTDDDVAFYEAHGWWISPPVLGSELLDQAAAAADAFYRDNTRALPFSDGYSNWTPADGFDVVRNNEFVSLQSSTLAQLACQPALGAIAARLARVDEIRVLDDQLVYKPPQLDSSKTVVGWHADHAYWGTCSSDRLLTAWIPFHDIDEERGTMVVLDGSHRWSRTEHTRFFNNPDLDAVEKSLTPNGHATRVPFRLSRGQVSFHHSWTLHASYSNRSPTPRLAFAVHLQDGNNHYQPCWTGDGREVHIFDERLCRRLPNGDPDFADPAVFPTVWPRR